jgi:hypothetical protein
VSDSAHSKSTDKEQRIDFNALYLDTNALLAGNWPAPTLRLENLLALTMWLDVSVFIPEPVEREVEQHWLREVRDSSAGLQGSIENFRRITRRVSGTAKVDSEDEIALVERYRALAASNKKAFRISMSPMPNRSLSEFFDMAIQYSLPFVSDSGKKGKGFQDAVILASVLEHLKANPSLSGLLVTDDGVFSKINPAKFMPTCAGVGLKVLSFDEASKVLYDGYWDVHVKQPWEEEMHNAEEAVKGMEPELRSFLLDKMDEAALQAGASSSALKLLSVEEVKVSYVNTPLPNPAKPHRSARIAIAITAKCRVMVSKDYRIWSQILSGTTPSGPSEVDMTWLGGIEASAEVKEHKFVNIKPVSILPASQLGDDRWIRQ